MRGAFSRGSIPTADAYGSAGFSPSLEAYLHARAGFSRSGERTCRYSNSRPATATLA